MQYITAELKEILETWDLIKEETESSSFTPSPSEDVFDKRPLLTNQEDA